MPDLTPFNQIRHTIIFALAASSYPILYFFSQNLGKAYLHHLPLPLILSLLFVSTLAACFYLILCNLSLAILAATIFYAVSWGLPELTEQLALYFKFSEQVILPTICILLLVGILAVCCKLKQQPSITLGLFSFLNASSIFLLGFLCWNINKKYSDLTFLTPDNLPEKISFTGSLKTTKPNIYYIILDAYGRSDVLRNIYNIDNSDFEKSLEQLNFHITKESYSNYTQTILALSSTLNLQYINSITEKVGVNQSSRAALQSLFRSNIVMRELKSQGYQVVTIPTGYSGTDLPEADITLEQLSLDEFTNLIITSSALPDILRLLGLSSFAQIQYQQHRNRINYAFDAISQAADILGPKFVFVHIVCPHPPFVFNRLGEANLSDKKFTFADGSGYVVKNSTSNYIYGYREQLLYVNTRIQQALTDLVAKDPEALIILQGDHGPGSRLFFKSVKKTDMHERHAIFNAYRVPEGLKSQLYASISPVNSFRVILSWLFNQQLAILPDKTYFSKFKTPYKFHDVTERREKS